MVTYPYVDFGKHKLIVNIQFNANIWVRILLWTWIIFCNEWCILCLSWNMVGLNISKQRLLSAHLPFLPASISEQDKLSYLSSCISFDSHLMVRKLCIYHPINQSISVQEVIINSHLFLIIFVCVCVHPLGSWGHWVLCWNVWTGGEWEWSWKTAVFQFLSCTSTPTHCKTFVNVWTCSQSRQSWKVLSMKWWKEGCCLS